MSKKFEQSEEEEEEEESEDEEEEEEERFYESLDRILSSSNSSTSNSDDGTETCRRGSHRNGKLSSCLPPNYDIWVSVESFSRSSIDQRRDRLLQVMGLSSDAVLSRRRPEQSVSFDVGGTYVGDHTSHQTQLRQLREHFGGGGDYSHIDRSKSDQYNSSSSFPSRCSDSIISISCVSADNNTVHRDSYIDQSNAINGGYDKCNAAVGDGDSKNCNGVGAVDDGGVALGLGCTNKPPLGRSGSNRVKRECGFGEGGKGGVGEVVVEEIEIDKACRIKNLDNGKEFVVKEVREDGMWNKLKEVGTGRHLTMEEFEMCVGHSPIVQELMRRQNVEDRLNNSSNRDNNGDCNGNGNRNGENGTKSKKKASWLRSIKNVASSMTRYRERRSSDERDTSSEKGGRRSSSATDDSQESTFHGPERVRVRQYSKSVKDLTALYKSQEIQAHNGSIWTIKFSLDGRYLASAGEDCVIHVWQVVEVERKGELLIDRPDVGSLNMLLLANGSPELNSVSPSLDNTLDRRKRRGRTSISRKSVSLEHSLVPDTVFALSEKPICSFLGHSDDVLDLSWSKSQLLLSSSMDKTVRLWNLSSKTCLKIFSHSDYVTCIQFNPVDDRYFISGSLDAKVRIWNIPDHQVVDWNDLHEMVTAACYTPDGQGALVGSYKGSCRLYNTSENKLQRKCHINLQNKKKKSHLKKITGFVFAPGSSSEVLITSADSRVRVVNGVDLVHKFKGFRNPNSQISASLTANGKYVVCASEDSHVYVWKHEGDSRPSRSKGITTTRSYEHFHCQDVSVATPWPGTCQPPGPGPHDLFSLEPNSLDEVSTANHPSTPVEELNGTDSSPSGSGCSNSPFRGSLSNAPNGYIFDRLSATWPEEKLLLAAKNRSPRVSLDFSNGLLQNRAAWGIVIVTAGLRGEIRTFQNFGLPVRL